MWGETQWSCCKGRAWSGTCLYFTSGSKTLCPEGIWTKCVVQCENIKWLQMVWEDYIRLYNYNHGNKSHQILQWGEKRVEQKSAGLSLL